MSQPRALDLVAEATALFRSRFARDAWVYYLGATPFVAAAVYLRGQLVEFQIPAEGVISAAAILLVLYVLKILADGAFCRRLADAPAPSRRPRGEAALGSAPKKMLFDARLQELAARCLFIFAWLLAAPLLLGLAPLYLAAQVFPVIAAARDDAEDASPPPPAAPRRPAGLARRWFSSLRLVWTAYPQIAVAALTAALGALAMAVNLWVAAIILPRFLASLAGQDAWARPLGAEFGANLIVAVAAFTYLLFDPWWKCFAVRLHFALASRRSGADLEARLRQLIARAAAASGGAA